MKDSEILDLIRKEEHATYKSYTIGFVLSIVLTLIAYFMVVSHWMEGWNLILGLAGLATAQVLVQLIFFLHLGREPSPPWNFIIFSFMIGIVFILVVCTIWIMYNLDYRMMPKL